MGSSNSSLGSRSSRPRVNRGVKRTLSSLICGGSTSHTPIDDMDDYPAELLPCSSEGCDPVVDGPHRSTKENSSILCSDTERSHSTFGASSDSSNGTIEPLFTEYRSRPAETSNDRKFFSESKKLVPGPSISDNSPTMSSLERTGDIGSSSSVQQQCSQSASVGSSLDAVVGVDCTKNEGKSQICLEEVCSSSLSRQEVGGLCANGVLPFENPVNRIPGVINSDSSSVPIVSDSSITSQSVEVEAVQEATPSGPGFLMLDRERDRSNGGVLHVDVVSISSSALFSSSGETSNHEARRNSRRLFWDAFSRRSSRRHSDSRTIVFSSEDSNDLGSHDRWLLDFSGDLFEDGISNDSGHFGSRSRDMYEGRWHSRSEIWERFRGGLDESSRQTTFCATGLHPEGTCSCESFLTAEESGTRGSISRIVMLAEALFEVLDEIHRQPVSLSLSMVSLPAPESVVNSFPLKSHKKPIAAEGADHDVEQCYICLAEYEDGDKIRVLPCLHEYHMSCVDKWLKEIHGVCPLCRRDVSAGLAEGSISNS